MNFGIHLVSKDSPAAHRGLLHDLKADALLTFNPSIGDKIIGEGSITINGNKLTLNEIAADLDWTKFWKIGTHPGRAPLLGEDDLDGAFDNSILPALSEKVWRTTQGNYYLRTHAWKYLPITAKTIEDLSEPETYLVPEDILSNPQLPGEPL